MEQYNYTREGRIAAIISYLWIPGIIVAVILNSQTKNRFAAFHIRQAIGVALMFLITTLFAYKFLGGFLGSVLWFASLILWIFGIVAAINEEEKEVPVLGPYFQKWFSSIL